MKYTVESIGQVELLDKDQIGSGGGEGNVFGKNGVAYKIYNDPSKMIPVKKINELSVLSSNKNVIIPEKLIFKNNNPVGYTMRMIEGHELCKLFTIDFKNQEHLTNKKIISLAKNLRDLVDFIHSKQILLVDLNELNFIVDNYYKEIYAIDTNSYQTKSFPATAIMQKINDFHSNVYTELTDWYSWGVVVFQLITGLHPYRGGNPKFDNMPAKDRLIARMKAGVSVFDKDSTLPDAVPDFNTIIPKGLLNWFKSIFGDNKRSIPPIDFNDFIAITQNIIKHIAGSNLFDIKELFKAENNIVNYYSYNNNIVLLCFDKCFYNSVAYKIPEDKNGCIKFTEKKNNPLYLFVENNYLKIYDILSKKFIDCELKIDGIFEYKNNIFVKNSYSILELDFLEFNEVKVGYKNVGSILDLPLATKIIDGGILQNLLGRYYLSVFPTNNKCIQIPIKELDDYKIINAKHCDKVLIVYGCKNNIYDRFIIKFDDAYVNYKIFKKENVDLSSCNFVVNSSGTVVFINEENEIELFKNDINNDNVKIVKDKTIDSGMILKSNNSQIMFIRNEKIFLFSMK